MNYYEVAIITGGASGIGREICLWLARRGTKIIIADLDYERAKEVENIIIQSGGEAKAQKTDVSEASEVEALISGTFCPGFIETPIHDASPNVSEFLNSEKNKRPPGKYPVAKDVINSMMKGIEKNRAIIIAPYKHKVYWWLYRMFPSLVPVMWAKIIRYLKK